MTVSLVLVTSINGKLTKAGAPSSSWASAEDQQWFEKLKLESDAVVMGAKTYEAARALINPTPQLLRMVLTSQPERYSLEHQPDALEFVLAEPAAVVAELKERGKQQVLVVGGAKVAADFIASKMITDIWLTLEPLYFSAGLNLDGEKKPFAAQLKLESCKQLNDQGSLLLHYVLPAMIGQ